jgi:excisionase family DNA binding protein
VAKNLSTFTIAQMLQVDPGSVANWIDQNLLKAHRTPGGHRRVAAEDLVRFLKDHRMPIPPDLQADRAQVVVVDDEPSVTRLIARAIQLAYPEMAVAEAHDGFEAGTMVATDRPEVVILDLRMPGLDGFEVCRRIKAQESACRTQVVAMTAYPSPENEKRILECGAKVCLSKPLDMDRLMKEIKSCLSR